MQNPGPHTGSPESEPAFSHIPQMMLLHTKIWKLTHSFHFAHIYLQEKVNWFKLKQFELCKSMSKTHAGLPRMFGKYLGPAFVSPDQHAPVNQWIQATHCLGWEEGQSMWRTVAGALASSSTPDPPTKALELALHGAWLHSRPALTHSVLVTFHNCSLGGNESYVFTWQSGSQYHLM